MKKRFVAIALIVSLLVPTSASAAASLDGYDKEATCDAIVYKGIGITKTVFLNENGEEMITYGLTENSISNPDANSLLVEFLHKQDMEDTTSLPQSFSTDRVERFKLTYGDPVFDTVAMESSQLEWRIPTISAERKLSLNGTRKIYGYNKYSASQYSNRRVGIQEFVNFSITSPSYSVSWPNGLSVGMSTSTKSYSSEEKIALLGANDVAGSHTFAGTNIEARLNGAGLTGNIVGTYGAIVTVYYGTNSRDLAKENSMSMN